MVDMDISLNVIQSLAILSLVPNYQHFGGSLQFLLGVPKMVLPNGVLNKKKTDFTEVVQSRTNNI